MLEELKQAVLRAARQRSCAEGAGATRQPGLYLVQHTSPTALEHTVVNPMMCLVLQGRKQVAMRSGASSHGAGDTLLVTSDVPAASRISHASPASPYLALALDLDRAVLTDLVVNAPDVQQPPVPHDARRDLYDALRRLVQLLDRPAALAVLQQGLVREIHHWLLMGPQGAAIRNLGVPDGHAQRIARAVAILRTEYAKNVPIERLAAAAGMSRSAFHQHFLALTSLTPLQFQKALRLIEARRLLVSKHKSSSQAAFEVGYESASQFSREYARMYGRPPIRDQRAALERQRQGRTAPDSGPRAAAQARQRLG